MLTTLGSSLNLFPQGEFGMMYKGSLKTGFTDTIRDTVAVKTLKGSYGALLRQT